MTLMAFFQLMLVIGCTLMAVAGLWFLWCLSQAIWDKWRNRA